MLVSYVQAYSTELYVPLLMGGRSGHVQPCLCMCVSEHRAVAEGGCHLFALGPQRTTGCQGPAQQSRGKKHGGVEEGGGLKRG